MDWLICMLKCDDQERSVPGKNLLFDITIVDAVGYFWGFISLSQLLPPPCDAERQSSRFFREIWCCKEMSGPSRVVGRWLCAFQGPAHAHPAECHATRQNPSIPSERLGSVSPDTPLEGQVKHEPRSLSSTNPSHAIVISSERPKHELRHD